VPHKRLLAGVTHKSPFMQNKNPVNQAFLAETNPSSMFRYLYRETFFSYAQLKLDDWDRACDTLHAMLLAFFTGIGPKIEMRS
jgi:hypothetical protein